MKMTGRKKKKKDGERKAKLKFNRLDYLDLVVGKEAMSIHFAWTEKTKKNIHRIL